jgi:hypothetical protein
VREQLGFLKLSSVVVKIAAWIFLFFGLAGGLSIIRGIVPGYPRFMGAMVLIIYAFSFFFFYLIAKIIDLIIQIINRLNNE